MANYGELLDEIALRLNRSGDASLSGVNGVIPRFAIDRIYFYSGSELFYPSERVDTSLVLVPGQMMYSLPAGTLQVLFVRILVGGAWMTIDKMDYREMLRLDIQSPANQSTASCYSLFGGKIRFWPRVQSSGKCELTVEAAPLPPSALTDVNFWTNEAFTLIVEAACEDISRLYLNDEARANRHAQAVERELKMLRKQTLLLGGPVKVRPYL